MEVLGVLDEISEAHQISNAGVALAWIMNRPGVTAPIASATKSSHLKAFDEAVSVNLSEQEIEERFKNYQKVFGKLYF